jgi:hypothetical protein
MQQIPLLNHSEPEVRTPKLSCCAVFWLIHVQGHQFTVRANPRFRARSHPFLLYGHLFVWFSRKHVDFAVYNAIPVRASER